MSQFIVNANAPTFKCIQTDVQQEKEGSEVPVEVNQELQGQ